MFLDGHVHAFNDGSMASQAVCLDNFTGFGTGMNQIRDAA
jgi:hypothetical protein